LLNDVCLLLKSATLLFLASENIAWALEGKEESSYFACSGGVELHRGLKTFD